MPKMDGITFLGNLMRLRPLPVVMISTLTEKGADVTLRSLEYGAVDFIAKPKLGVPVELPGYSSEIISKVKVAALANVLPFKRKISSQPPTNKNSADVVLNRASQRHFQTTDKIIGIGASTGGTEAIKEVLSGLPPDMPSEAVKRGYVDEVFSLSRISQRLINLLD